MEKFYSPRIYADGDTLLMVWLSGVSHGLGLGLGLLHTVELWLWCLQGPSLSLGGC